MDLVVSYKNTSNLLTDARQIIDQTRELAFRSVNVAMLQRNWHIQSRSRSGNLNNDKEVYVPAIRV